jgi:hypothetical protein
VERVKCPVVEALEEEMKRKIAATPKLGAKNQPD